MNKRYFTLFVLKNDASRARQVKVPVGLFKGAAAVLTAFIFIFAFVIYDYARLKGDTAELYSLRKENTSQKIELQSFSAKIKDLETQFAKLSLFDKKLRIIANLEVPKGQSEQLMGMGGPSPEDEEYFGTAGSRVDELVGRMRSEISTLEDRAKMQENSFTELQDSLAKQSTMLASTPSIWPSRGWVTSVYGQRVSPFTGFLQQHSGIDIANRMGTPIVAPATGIVIQAGRDTGLGKMVAISHGYGIKTVYGHLSEIFVKVGQKVKRGDKIAAMGSTGRSTGPHLHYEVSLNGMSVNPSKYILN